MRHNLRMNPSRRFLAAALLVLTPAAFCSGDELTQPASSEAPSTVTDSPEPGLLNGPELLDAEFGNILAGPTDATEWLAPATAERPEAEIPAVPEPAGAVMVMALGLLVMLMTVLRWRFDRMSVAMVESKEVSQR